MADTKLDPKIKEILESDIFEYLELESIPEEDKAKMMENLILSLRSRVMLRIADQLEAESTEKFEQFKNILNDEKVTQGDVDKFLTDNKVNLDIITAEESILLKAEVMGLKRPSNDKGGDNGEQA